VTHKDRFIIQVIELACDQTFEFRVDLKDILLERMLFEGKLTNHQNLWLINANNK